MSDGHQCGNCGAPTSAGPDGRTHTCRYCGVSRQIAVGAAQVMAGLRVDLARADEFLERLAATLGSTYADLTRVHSHGGRIASFELNLDPDLFLVKREARGLVAQHKKLVRGVALKTTTHPIDRWAEMLAAALAAHANTSAQASQVLERIRLE
jgi:hypothetical protein